MRGRGVVGWMWDRGIGRGVGGMVVVVEEQLVCLVDAVFRVLVVPGEDEWAGRRR